MFILIYSVNFFDFFQNLTTQIHTSNENDEYMPRVDELLSWLGDKQSEEDYNWESSLDQMDAVMATLKKYLDVSNTAPRTYQTKSFERSNSLWQMTSLNSYNRGSILVIKIWHL